MGRIIPPPPNLRETPQSSRRRCINVCLDRNPSSHLGRPLVTSPRVQEGLFSGHRPPRNLRHVDHRILLLPARGRKCPSLSLGLPHESTRDVPQPYTPAHQRCREGRIAGWLRLFQKGSGMRGGGGGYCVKSLWGYTQKRCMMDGNGKTCQRTNREK